MDVEFGRLLAALAVSSGEMSISTLGWPHSTGAQIQVGGLNLDLASRAVSRCGQAIQLSSLEFRLLAYLARDVGRVIPTSEVLEAVWGASALMVGTLEPVKGLMKRLRSKIEPLPHEPRYIKSIRGRGYVLKDLPDTSS
jgi:DNA-binding response OmpR family regulator